MDLLPGEQVTIATEGLREYGLENDAAWSVERFAARETAPALDLVGETIESSAA